MKTHWGAALGVICGAAVCAEQVRAAGTRFVMEGSYLESEVWSTSILASAGTPIRARLRAELVGNETVTGLAGFNTQFTISNWGAGEVLGAWGTPPTNIATGAGGLAPFPWSPDNGRLFPFAASATAALPQASFANGVLSITGSVSNRIPIGQGPSSLAGTNYNDSLSPQVFQLTFTPSFQTATSYVVTPFNIFNTTANNAKWYTGTGSTTINAPGTEIVPLVVSLPAPGGVGVIALAGAWAVRRRR